MIKISKQSDIEKYLDENKNVKFDGCAEIFCDLKIEFSLFCDKSIIVKAGDSIEAGDFILSFNFDISCKKIITKLLPFWRKYFSEMKPLGKWKNQILNEENCWVT